VNVDAAWSRLHRRNLSAGQEDAHGTHASDTAKVPTEAAPVPTADKPLNSPRSRGRHRHPARGRFADEL